MRPRYLFLRGIAVTLGLCVVALVALDWRRVAQSGETVGPGHLPAILIGLTILAIGLLGRRTGAAFRGTAFTLLQVLLLVLVAETISGAVLWNRARVRHARQASDMAALPYYQHVPWGAKYWKEFALSDAQYYMPFTTFRRLPFTGQYINVGADRLRVTPGADCAPGSYVVYALGGSTMWGTGAPDSGTIAAYLQRGFSARMSRPVCVVNFGESAYVATQGLIGLSLALRAGAHPDLVLSYDGVNDVFAAYQSGHAGVHQNEASIAAGYPRPYWALDMLTSSATFALLRGNATGGRSDTLPAAELADSVSRIYLGAVREMRALGAAYGFQTLFFWQPEIGQSGKTFTPYEAQEARRQNKRLTQLYAESYKRVHAAADSTGDDLFDISRVLSNDTRELFIDYAHIVPDGNALVANAMLAAWDSSAAGKSLSSAPRSASVQNRP